MQFKTQATYVDKFTIQCDTPDELLDEADLELKELDLILSLHLQFNGMRYYPNFAHKMLRLVKWPVIRKLTAKQPVKLSNLDIDSRLSLLENRS